MSLYLGTSPVANTGYNKANTDLSNLASTGKNIANWSNNVTNCITEIPQDIKLELNNGTLTLKAGSKVYVPNGPGVFDVVTIENDVTHISTVTGTNKQLLFYRLTSNSITCHWNTLDCFSGTTTPTQQTYIYYNTTTNQIRYTISGTTFSNEVVSLPIAEITLTDGQFTSIDKVFNGFGYIGSTAFALPGVKGLIPNGRNADGSLKSVEYNRTSVRVDTFSISSYTGPFNLYCFQLRSAFQAINYYDEKTNTMLNNYNGSFISGDGYLTKGKITSFTPKTAFHALDYNDSSTISGWSMPSDRSINLTLGASGASYKAPANGWVLVGKQTNGTSLQNIYIKINGYPWGICWTSSSYNAFVYAPVCKGQIFNVNYTADGATQVFRFIYAEGEN